MKQISLSHNRGNPLDRDDYDFISLANRNAFQVRLPTLIFGRGGVYPINLALTKLGALQPFLHPIDCLTQSASFNRLEQVIDGIHFKGTDSILVISCHKCDQWHSISP